MLCGPRYADSAPTFPSSGPVLVFLCGPDHHFFRVGRPGFRERPEALAHAPFSVRRSTRCPGSGMRGIRFRRGSPDRRAEPPNRTTSAPQRFLWHPPKALFWRDRAKHIPPGRRSLSPAARAARPIRRVPTPPGIHTAQAPRKLRATSPASAASVDAGTPGRRGRLQP